MIQLPVASCRFPASFNVEDVLYSRTPLIFGGVLLYRKD